MCDSYFRKKCIYIYIYMRFSRNVGSGVVIIRVYAGARFITLSFWAHILYDKIIFVDICRYLYAICMCSNVPNPIFSSECTPQLRGSSLKHSLASLLCNQVKLIQFIYSIYMFCTGNTKARVLMFPPLHSYKNTILSLGIQQHQIRRPMMKRKMETMLWYLVAVIFVAKGRRLFEPR